MDLHSWIDAALEAHSRWTGSFPDPGHQHESLSVDETEFAAAFEEFSERLGDNYPFFHPSYAGQMLKPPHPVAVVGYVSAMLINPNNHALDGGPATAQMEKEVVAQLATMFGFDAHLGHLTSSGTIANLEALFVARSVHPQLGIAHSTAAHYTHARMAAVLGMDSVEVATDEAGRMDLDHLVQLLATGTIGTVVATAGTTGLGAVDPIHDIVALARQHGARVHVDAAYGGFFALLAGSGGPSGLPAQPWQAIRHCDSVVIDPHKHGLQPYGCGAVLFADPTVGQFFAHDSPYTYFTSDQLHLGEISLECSRAGAAAAALWLTLRVLPLSSSGLGAVLAAGRRAALRFNELMEQSSVLASYQRPELDIVTYFPQASALSDIDHASREVLRRAMVEHPRVFLSTLRVRAAQLQARHRPVRDDRAEVTVLRSVLMKPEFENAVEGLHQRIEQVAREVLTTGAA